MSNLSKKYIGTWIYLDTPEEESKFPNNKGKSSTPEFQAVYWRCVIVFFESSIRCHGGLNDVQHILFTNTANLPIIDGLDLDIYFKDNNIKVVQLENKYPLPKNYFTSFRNQFFEFSIIDKMATIMDDNDCFLLLDSDCIFSKSIYNQFDVLETTPAQTLTMSYGDNYVIHGITRIQMQKLFHELGLAIKEVPLYCGGELLLTTGAFIKEVAKDFPKMFAFLLNKNDKGLPKFNEEAHVLSYYYYKHGALIGNMNKMAKRMWTNRNVYRNIKKGDEELYIWHMPNEKPVGFANSYKFLAKGNRFNDLSDDEYTEFIRKTFLKASNHKIDIPRYARAQFKKILAS